ncbi:YbhB/YbcL family Raf kinase inhibitor-like protein [Halolamina litorea]|uniref:YbhB/YbcL family Raf kinase inhibitor-like protein n=1 Tax=Halolamina litorea TaxID=1515593 RepID=A0ABD6BRW0_9EURY
MQRRRYLAGTSVAFAAGLAGCGGGDGAGADSGFSLTATAFADGGTIPARYTCEGGDVNPELTIDGVPDDAETLALVVDDPDAGDQPYVHWLLWNVPVSTTTIPRSVSKTERPPFAEGARQGTNSAGEIGYMGPCPPVGDEPHRYRFRLSAVGTTLDLDAGAGRGELDDALSGAVVDEVTLTGRYGRD